MLQKVGSILWLILTELYYAIFRCRPKKNIHNQHIVITGTAQGLGAQFARKFAELDNIVHCVDVNESLNQDMVDELTKKGHQAFAYKADVSSWESLCKLKENIEKNGGSFVSYVINNAGVGTPGYLVDKSPEEIALTLKVNLLGQILVTKQFLPDMLKRDEGHVVNIASVAGYFPMLCHADYSASKGGSVMFTESLRMDLKSCNAHINITVVCPYVIATQMTEGINPASLTLPILTSEGVADDVILGVRENKELMLLPRTKLNIGLFMKNMVPAKINAILEEGARLKREDGARAFVVKRRPSKLE